MNATLFDAWIPIRDLFTNLRKKNVGCKVLHFINNENQEALSYKTLRRTASEPLNSSIYEHHPF